MRRARRRLVGVLSLSLASSCETEPPPPPPLVRGSLEGGVVARVGPLDIHRESVELVAQSQQIPPREAADLLIQDALFAIEAERRGLASSPRTSGLIRRALARRLIEHWRDAARKEGPITDAELAEWTERAWIELARPESFVTVHAVVMPKKGYAKDVWSEADWVEAREVAGVVKKRVAPAIERAKKTQAPEPSFTGARYEDEVANDFIERAKAVSSDFKVHAELLYPPVTREGYRVAPARSRLDSAFTEAATGLGSRGDVSELVETPFGVHVILLLDRIAESMVPEDERRELLLPAVLDARLAERQKEALEALRPLVEVDPQADGILAELPASSGEGGP